MVNQCLRNAWRLLSCILLATLLAAPAQAGKGKKHFNEGRKAEQRNDFDAALVAYEQAAKEEPKNAQYLLAARRMRFQAAMTHVDRGHKLRSAGKLQEALQEFERAFAIDPASSIAEQELRRTVSILEAQKAPVPPEPPKPLTPREQAEKEALERLEQVEGPVNLAPVSRTPITLKATNESKILFETVGKLAGINVLFDPDFASRRISIELTNVTLEQALDHIAVMTKNLWKPLTTNTIFVYGEAKRRDHEPQVIKTFYLSNIVQPQEITEIAQTIRNLLEARLVQQVTLQNAIIIRDTPDKVAIVEKIISDLDKSKPEVVIDVAVLQVRRDRAREIGLFPGSPGLQIPVTFTPGGAQPTTTTTPGTGTGTTPGTGTGTGTTGVTSGGVTVRRLAHLGSGDFSLVVPGGALNLLFSDGSARLLQNPQVRASDNVPAKLRIGERIPIATGSFQPGIGGVGINPLVNTQFQYTDVGVILEITPKVHAEREVSMKVMVEISSVTSRVNIGGIDQPVIGQRRIEEEIRLREGEMNILGGIIENQLTNSLSGIPGLSQIPGVKHLFSSTRQEVAENEVLIVLTPHIVRLPQITAANLRGIDVGTQTNVQIRTRPAVMAPPAPAAAPAAAPASPPTPAPTAPPAATPAPTPAPASPEKPAAESPTPAGPQATGPPVRLPGILPAAPDVRPETPASPPGATATALRFSQPAYNPTLGGTFTVDVYIDQAQNLSALPFQLHYDPKLLKLVNVVQGDFLGRDGQTVGLAQQVNHENGTANITLSRPPDAPGVSGTGIVATISFQAVGSGESALNILRAIARGAAQQPMEVSGTRSRVIVR